MSRLKLFLRIFVFFIALANDKYMWSGNLQLQLSCSLAFSQCLGQNNHLLEKLSWASQLLLILLLALISVSSMCTLLCQTQTVSSLQLFSLYLPPKFLKLSSTLIVSSTTHTHILNLHLRLLAYAPDPHLKPLVDISFWIS